MMIAGILDLTTRTTYGSRNGKLLYRVNCSEEGVNVTTTKPPGNVYYVWIKYEDNKWVVVDYIGTPGNYVADCTYLIAYLNIYYPPHQKKLKYITDAVNEPTTAEYNIFTIDPRGAEDHDDGFHFTDKEIGIHITDISSISDKLIQTIKSQPESIYVDKNYHMLPCQTMQSGSFVECTYRYSVSLLIKGEILEWKLSTVKIEKNYTYDDKFTIPEWVYKKFNVTIPTDLVAQLMQFYNQEAAKLLKKEKSIFRDEQYTEEYCGYVHVTSPLRRLVDLVTQKQLVAVLKNKKVPQHNLDLEFINEWKQNSKKANLLFQLLKTVYQLPKEETVDMIYTGLSYEKLVFKIPKYNISHIYNFDSKSILIDGNKTQLRFHDKLIIIKVGQKLKGKLIPNTKAKFPTDKLLLQPHF
jgi:hypothetical protein